MFIIWQPWLAHETDHGTHPQHVLFTIVVSKPKPDVRLAVMRGVSGCIYAFPSLGGDQRQSWVTKMVARWGGSRDERSDGGIRAILRQHCTRSSSDLRVIYYIYIYNILSWNHRPTGSGVPTSLCLVPSRNVDLSQGSPAAPGTSPARPFPPSIFLDKNRRDIGESQSTWTDSEMETAGSPGGRPARAVRRSR
jgi:hypothetical protein